MNIPIGTIILIATYMQAITILALSKCVFPTIYTFIDKSYVSEVEKRAKIKF